MTTLFFILLGLGLFHFIYEGIILPSYRMKLRYDLFALRDKLRRTKAEKGEAVDKKVYLLIQESLNNQIKFLPHITINLVWRALRDIKADPELATDISQRIALVNNTDLPELKEINEAGSKILATALIWNSLGLLIYVLPLIVAVMAIVYVLGFIFKSIVQACKTDIEQVSGVVYLPEPEVEKMANGSIVLAA